MIDLRNKLDVHPHQKRHTPVGGSISVLHPVNLFTPQPFQGEAVYPLGKSMLMGEQSLAKSKNIFDPLGEPQIIDNKHNRKISV